MMMMVAPVSEHELLGFEVKTLEQTEGQRKQQSASQITPAALSGKSPQQLRTRRGLFLDTSVNNNILKLAPLPAHYSHVFPLSMRFHFTPPKTTISTRGGWRSSTTNSRAKSFNLFYDREIADPHPLLSFSTLR